MSHIDQKTGDKAYPPLVKTPISLEAAGYTVHWDDGSRSTYPDTWIISHPKCSTIDDGPVIARFETDREKGMLIIHEAWNRYKDPVKTLSLRDMVLSLWIFQTRNHPDYLKIIKVDCIIQEEAQELLPKLYEKLEQFPETYINHSVEIQEEQPSVRITRKPAPGEDRKVHRSVWPTLCTRICFIKGVLNMIKEYAELKGRSIHSVIWTECGNRDWSGHGQLAGHPFSLSANMYIYLGGEGTPWYLLDEVRQDALEARARNVRVIDARKAAEALLAAPKEVEDDKENEDPVDDEIGPAALEHSGALVIDARKVHKAAETQARLAALEDADNGKDNEEALDGWVLIGHGPDEAQPD